MQLSCRLSILRQHGVCPDSAWRFPAAGAAGSLPASGDFRRQHSISEQHQHAVHLRLHLRWRRKQPLLQSGAITAAGGRSRHRRHRRGPRLPPHFAGLDLSHNHELKLWILRSITSPRQLSQLASLTSLTLPHAFITAANSAKDSNQPG